MEAIVQEARELGRTFRLVGLIPGVVLTAYIFVVVSARDVDGGFDPSSLLIAIEGLNLADLGFGVATSLALAFLLQPLQFSLVQLLEGYWGAGVFGHRLRLALVGRNLVRWGVLQNRLREVHAVLARGPDIPALVRWSDDGTKAPTIDLGTLDAMLLADELERELYRYPRPHRMMPTRLGNMLRRHEDRAGQRWGLDTVTIASYVGLSAAEGDVAYLNDRRNEMDTAVRFVLTWAIAALVTLGVYWSQGVWAMLTAVPWSLAVLSYRGAVGAADHYGEALAVVISLNRKALYERLGMPVLEDLEQEMAQNRRLARHLRSNP